MSKYAIGIDYGTLSARALVVEIGTGREVGTAVMNYPHAVMDEKLPSGKKLMPDWALQHPDDYLQCMQYVVPKAMEDAGVNADDVVGLGVDFTTCTTLPIDKDGTPLCLKSEFSDNPHAYVMLWKHHAAQGHANRMTEIAEKRGEPFLERNGGKVSSERIIPKIWQILEEAPEVFEAADRFIEAGDWLNLMLTGEEARSSCFAGYKAFWHKKEGYPSKDFLKALDPRLENLVEDKLSNDIHSIGTCAGHINEYGAKLTGLKVGTAVAVAHADAHVALPAAGITKKGQMLMIMGPSSCHIMLSDTEVTVPGICGVVEDGAIQGLLAYEAGQTCVGDHFNWFVENCVPEAYAKEAAEKGVNLHVLLTEKAAKLKAGESGLLALDWWNGNRSILVDVDLTGMMLGMTLTTKPEEMYRALIEATAYGTRIIIENFEKYGVQIDELFACGGIAQKNAFLMQLYADVLGREIRIARSTQNSALGSAMFGALAAGKANGGYDDMDTAAAEMGGVQDKTYKPDMQTHEVYNKLYDEYVQLHDLFGRGGNDVMRRLKQIKKDAREV